MTTSHVVTAQRDAYERGYALGTYVRKKVHANLEIYMKRFDHYGLTRHAVLTIAKKFRPVIEKYDDDMFQEIRGVAESTDLKVEEILALNVRYELMWGSWAEGCTSLAVQPEASERGHTLVGQNWDWVDSVRASCHTWYLKGKPKVLCFTEAGIVGPKIGLNSAGLSLTINGLVSGRDGIRKGVPFHLICRHILNSSSMTEVLEFLESIPRAGSANFLISHVEGEILDVESSPDRLGYLYPNDGVLVHTNHFVGLDLEDVGRRRFPDSIIRYFRAKRLLHQRGKLGQNDLKVVLSDHFNFPSSICFHSSMSKPQEEREQTNASVLMDLNERAMWIARGNPCNTNYEKLHLER